MKKFLAITLTLALTLALFVSPIPANAVAATQSTTNVLFQDDFDAYVSYGTNNTGRRDAMIANGWEEQAQNAPFTAASTGSYIGTHNNSRNMMLSFENTKDWAGYSVSGTISFSDVQEERTGDVYGVYVMYANELAAGGYEIGFCLNVDGTKELIMRRRKSTLGGYDAHSCTSRIFDFKTDGTAYNIKAEYNLGIINCYVDGVLELSYDTSNDDVILTKGSAGIRKVNTDNADPNDSIGAAVTFDNFKVERAEKTVWFEENFTYGETDTIDSISGLTDTDIAGIKQNGALPVDFSSAHKYLINTKGTAAWNDYSVEADFTITRNNLTTSTGYFGLSGRMNESGKGYEFVIFVSSAGENGNKITARIRTLEKNDEKVKTENCYNFVSGSTYSLKLEFVGNTINGYINNNLVCSYVDDKNHSTRGTAGLNVAAKTECSVDVSVDNYKVTGYSAQPQNIDQNFDSVTATQLFKSGYQTNMSGGISAYAQSYISEGKISLPTEAQKTGFFSPTITDNNFTVEVDLTITATQAAGTQFGVLIGASEAEYKNCSYLMANSVQAGNISLLQYYKIGDDGKAVSTETVKTDNIGSSSRPQMGTPAKLTINVTYDESLQQSTIVFTVTSEGTVRATLEKVVSGTLAGKVGLYKSAAQGPCTFDNFKITSNTVREYQRENIGDIDGDGVVTTADATYIRNDVLAITENTADLNNDTVTDIRDLVHFKKVFEFYR